MQLTATVLDNHEDTVRNARVRWKSQDPTIASVSETGLLVGHRTGNTVITASAGGVTGSIEAFVTGFSNRAVISDDFTSYSNTSDFRKNTGQDKLYPVVTDVALISIDPGVTYQGHHTLRMDHPGNSTAAPTIFTYFPTPLSNFWFRAKVRFSPGWQSIQTAPGAADTFMHWGWPGVQGYRGEISFVNNGEYRLQWYAEGASALTTTPAGDVGSEWTDGEWYDYIVHYERLSQTSTRTSFWLAREGEEPVLRATVVGQMATGAAPFADRIQLGQEFTAPHPASQAVWIGQWEVIDGTQYRDPYDLLS